MTENNKKIILLVEDDPAIADIYTTAFQNSGFDIDVLSTGAQAISRIKESVETGERKPAIVLLDLILPDMNGGKVLEAIKSDDSTRGIIVFILSNQQSLDFADAGIAKPDKFVVKATVTPTQVVQMVKEQLAP